MFSGSEKYLPYFKWLHKTDSLLGKSFPKAFSELGTS
jgi:hypothetical protein